jgi:hypothetical protein
MMPKNPREKETSEFDNLAREKRTPLIVEFWFFLKHNKKWWLLPILIMLLLLGLLVLLGGTAIAPFIYPLF